MTIFPVYIQPLFNKYSTLEEGKLKVRVWLQYGCTCT